MEGLIAQNPCTEVSFIEGEGSQFLIKGKGGLPASSMDVLTNIVVLTPCLDFSTETSVTLSNENKINILWRIPDKNDLSSPLCRRQN